MALTFVPNSTKRTQILAGTEAQRGVPVVPTYRWRGEAAVTKDRPLIRAEEATGTRDRFITPQQGIPSYAGNYTEMLTYQSLAQQLRYGLASGDSPTSDGNTVPGFTRLVTPGETLDSATLQMGHPGLGWESAGIIHNEFTVSWDFDDADGVWKWSSTLLPTSKDALPGTTEGVATAATANTLTMTGATWTVDEYEGAWVTIYGGDGYGQQRQITANTTTEITVSADWDVMPTAGSLFRIEGLFEAGIPNAIEDKILTPGTKVFVDALGLPIGSTQVFNRMISGSVTVANQLGEKWFAENIDSPSGKLDEGARIITVQLTMEFDRRDEYEQWEDLGEVSIRFQKDGPVIDATAGTNQQARVDIERAVWETPTTQTRNNNITATFGALAYVPLSDPIFGVQTITPVATLQ